MASDKKAFALRLDTALYDAVARLAAGELRSVNGQIEFLLREALKARGVRLGETNVANNNDANNNDNDTGEDR